MASMPWVKIYTEILDDVKLSKFTDAQKWRFIQLILLAATCDAAGAFVIGESLMTHIDISWRLRIDPEILEKDIKRMIEVGLLENDHGMLSVIKFAERQGPTQEHKRKQWRELQQARRDRIKNSNVIDVSLMTHAGVIKQDIDQDIDKDKKNASKNRARSVSVSKPPKHPKRQELINYFLIKTGLPRPMEVAIKAMQKQWWKPIDAILNFNGGDVAQAKDIIDQAVAKLKADNLTISDPNSILKTARSMYANRNDISPSSIASETY